MESLLRSGEYNALAGSQIKTGLFFLKGVEVFGFQSVTPTPLHLLSSPPHLLQWKPYGVCIMTFLILTQGGDWQKMCFIMTRALVWPT